MKPWPWYVSGPLIGLTVPLLLLLGNKMLGISSSLRHTCAAILPANIPFLKYNWKEEAWNLFFALGMIIGGFIGGVLLNNGEPVNISPDIVRDIQALGIHSFDGLIPSDIYNWSALFTLQGFVVIVLGAFMIGFGSRYAGGCTSGHAIMGLSNLQLPSLIATTSFMTGGFIVANLVLPYILKL